MGLLVLKQEKIEVLLQKRSKISGVFKSSRTEAIHCPEISYFADSKENAETGHNFLRIIYYISKRFSDGFKNSYLECVIFHNYEASA